MNKTAQPRFTALLLVFVFLAVTIAWCDSKPADVKQVTFSGEEAYICVDAVKSLLEYHYSPSSLDDVLSSEIFNNYMTVLDPTRHFFLQKEIQHFRKFEHQFDDFLKTGDLTLAYEMFNIHLNRSKERSLFLKKFTETWEIKLNFSKDETISLNRENIQWCHDKEAMKSLWRRELKNEIIRLKLEGSSNKEISDTLKKTYDSRLNLLSQTTSKDALQLFMNAVSTSFDPHTKYFAPRESEDFDIQMSQSLEGIGAVLQNEYQYTKVIRLIPSGPAEKSKKLMPGDRIIGVGEGENGSIKDTTGLRIDSVVDLIRGPKDTVVRLKIIPAQNRESSKVIRIKRDKVKLKEQSAQKSIETIERNGKKYTVGIIEIPVFYRDFNALHSSGTTVKSTTKDVAALIDQLKETGIHGLIIDLRNNGGGSLKEANLLTGLFIPAGPVVQIKSRNSITRLYDDDGEMAYKGPLVVMINRMSASASEIFAGAIQDYNRGIVVGARSFGKGTVQSLEPLIKGRLKITSAKFYRVSGQSTQKKGVVPDISYPHIYNEKEVGESAFENALPYDKTDKALYRPFNDETFNGFIDSMKKTYTQRAAGDAGMQYLKRRIALSKEINNIRSLSLNEQKRRHQKALYDSKELEILNNYLTSIGKASLQSLTQADEIMEETGDILMKQTHCLTADFIKLVREKQINW